MMLKYAEMCRKTHFSICNNMIFSKFALVRTQTRNYDRKRKDAQR